MEQYTQDQANIDVAASEDNILICEAIQPISEADRTEDQVGDLFRSEAVSYTHLTLPTKA